MTDRQLADYRCSVYVHLNELAHCGYAQNSTHGGRRWSCLADLPVFDAGETEVRHDNQTGIEKKYKESKRP